ncbi:MAG: sodium:solute symporter family protein [Acidobacteriota bacterium]|nr:sodium:solute symporter family protein [Acidobacteriota bacterium]
MAMLVIVLMSASFLAIGWAATRRNRDGSAADFIVAGRAMPLWLATMTMTATWVDGGYLLGTAEGVYRSSVATGLQGGVCFGISLILGGLFFARKMREHAFTTLIDPFEARFGPRWAVVLSLPAMLAEMFWSAELLVALGATFGVVLNMDLSTAILMSAAVVTLYTMAGGMWAVAYTDAFQLALVGIGLAAALPVALGAVGGLGAAWSTYAAARPDAAVLVPPLAAAGGFWTRQAIVSWWDVSIMLMLGGIPWNCYFQRVLSCRSPRDAKRHSILAGLLTIALTVPPLLFGLVAFAYPWPPELAARLAAQPADALPMIFKYVVPPAIGLFGLAAIVGAVTSSFSASILSAGSMFSWNTCTRLWNPDISFGRMKLVMRATIAALGIGAVWMALEVQSVQALWFFTSDLVFVLLFPQLISALFDSKANLIGSVAAFSVSLLLRVGGGEPLFGIAALIPYPEWIPFKTLAAGAGLVLLPLVSRLTAGLAPPRPLRNLGS